VGSSKLIFYGLLLSVPLGLYAQTPVVSTPTPQPTVDFFVLTNQQLMDEFNSTPKTTPEYNLSHDCHDEMILRGPTPEMVQFLLGVCQNGDRDHQLAAMDLLTTFHVKQATPLLVEWLGENGKSAAGVAGLVKMNDISTKPALIEFFRTTTDDQSKDPAMELLGRMNATEIIPELKTLLQNRLSYVAMSAACALGEMGDQSGRYMVIKSLTDNPYYVSADALRALAAFGNRGDLEFLEDLRAKHPGNHEQSDENIDIAECQIECKGLTPQGKLEKISKWLPYEQLPAVHTGQSLWAISQLGQMGTKRAKDLLEEIAVNNEAYAFREAAFKELFRFGIVLPRQGVGVKTTFTMPVKGTNE
jgi:hypothetical protein